MVNGKTFVKITNQQIFERIEDMDKKNDETHDEIKAQIERCRVAMNDHLHEHVIKDKERRERETRDRWLWGVVVAIVGIICGFIGSVL